VDYSALKEVLDRAYAQAAEGKGDERHAAGRDFADQPIQRIAELLSDPVGYGQSYQAVKKIQESARMDRVERRTLERLGAIVYLAGAIIHDEKMHVHAPVNLESGKTRNGVDKNPKVWLTKDTP
jgi:hypothetical protein